MYEFLTTEVKLIGSTVKIQANNNFQQVYSGVLSNAGQFPIILHNKVFLKLTMKMAPHNIV